MNTSKLQRFLREPLLHFIVIGGLFFLIYTAVNDAIGNSSDVILITPERIGQIAAEYNGVWNRMPTDEELDSLMVRGTRQRERKPEAVADQTTDDYSLPTKRQTPFGRPFDHRQIQDQDFLHF